MKFMRQAETLESCDENRECVLQSKVRNGVVPDDAAHRTKNTKNIKIGMQCTRERGLDFEDLRVGEYMESPAMSSKSLLERAKESGLK
jgi:hypothetical protein